VIAVLTGFVMGFVGSMPISGPISLLVFHRGMLARYRDGWAIGFGGAIAEGIYCAVAVLGVGAVHERFRFLEPLGEAMGILILFVLGLYFLLARQQNPEERSIAERSGATWVGQFTIGLTVAALNPTLLVTWSAAATMLYSVANLTLHTDDSMAFAASVIIGIAAWFGVLLALLQRCREHFPFLVLQRVIRGIGVVLIAASVLWAAWTLFA
jgi:threonine/homoserine/homoserine lactone efflux protein